METLLIIIISFILPLIAWAQKSDTLSQQSIDVINQIVRDKRYWVLLVGEIDDYSISEMRRVIGNGVFLKRIQDEKGNDLSEKLVLSKTELKSVKKAIAELNGFRWSEADAKKLHLHKIKTISSDSSLLPSLDISIKYRIVPPIFVRNGDYCFLYFDYACGPLCGATRFVILKRTINGWKWWHTLIQGDS